MGHPGTESHDDEAQQVDRFGLREGDDKDVSRVATMHASDIAEGFLATLGAPFLRRLYHRIVRSPYGFLIVAHDDERSVVGFVAGTTDTRRLYRQFLVREGPIVIATSGARLARSLPKVLETLRYGTGDAPSAEPELLALAVDEAWHRRGVGTALAEAFLLRVTATGAPTARVVVGAGNTAAIALYRRARFEAASEFEVHRGSTSRLMRTTLPGRESR
jgi:ribosomal protein S18 acetylase RimI-like enzyme